ncbi:hypothetical protein THAOC_03252 [Thalassiosira oceanica]|uniref:Uncharacterized protein n=2 Tax=Thalassiosira oceanica TaxID=159749 RepID=K0TD07_THAOC|nr:hypothetical protein THAOC_03252 [Thalassiosira oceanica]|eukprot:EJK75039.1 hypothetical protein THAOC_03252 [Thalassiosira oceanica]
MHETDATHQQRGCLSTINPESSAATLSGLSARRFSATAVDSFGDDGDEEDHPISDPSEHDKPEPSSQSRYEWTDETIRRGKFAWVSHDRQFGVITPSEEADSLVHGQKREEFFFNFRNLSDGELFRHESNQDALKPKIDTDEPVTFQLRRRTPESAIHAFNINYQDTSKNMVLLKWSGAIHLIRKSKAVLGHKVYAALDEARDPDELQTFVVQEYTKCRDRMNWAKSHIDRSTSARECKANFGDEIYDILDNASSVDDIQKRVDMAFWKCCNNLKLLSLTSPEKKLLRDHVRSNKTSE